MKEAVMTERRFRDNEYVRRGEALGSAAFGWILGIGAAVIIALLVIVSYSNTTDTASSTPPTATSNAPPRIPPSTTGSGAQPEQPSQDKPGAE
jgi:hypothetical protein